MAGSDPGEARRTPARHGLIVQRAAAEGAGTRSAVVADLYTHEEGHVEGVARGADTLEGAQGVLAVCGATRRQRALVLVHTLLVEGVLPVAVATPAAQVPGRALARVIAGAVLQAVLVQDTRAAGGVSRVAARTHAPEAAQRVDAGAHGPAQPALLRALVDV